MLDVSPIRAFSDNYIWLIRGLQQPGRAAVVDPGDAQPVIDTLEAQGLQLGAVLLTHHHGDHVGGAKALKERYAVPVVGPRHEAIAAVSRAVAGGEQVVLEDLGLQFEVLDIPGHTRGHIAFYGHEALFCGDTLFSAGCGRLFEGTAEQMNRSLGRLKTLPADTRVFCGHEYTVANLLFARAVEPENSSIRSYLETARSLRSSGRPTLPSNLALEIAVNPFLRCQEAAVREAAQQHAGHPLQTEVEVFAAVRRWKDGFTT